MARCLLFGRFHCERGLGIREHLHGAVKEEGTTINCVEGYFPSARVASIVAVPSQPPLDISAEEFTRRGLVGAGDFIILTDLTNTPSYESTHPM